MTLCAEGCLLGPLGFCRAIPPAKRQAPCRSRASGLHAPEILNSLNTREQTFSEGVIIIDSLEVRSRHEANAHKHWYSLLHVVRGVWCQSDGRGVWPSVEPERPPPKRRDPKGRGVWGFSRTTTKQLYLTFGSSLCLRFHPVKRADP